MEKDFIEINGEKIYFYLQRKSIKNINLKIKKDKTVIISIPKKMSTEKAKEFIKKKAGWIKKHTEKYEIYENQKESKNLENGNNVYFLGNQYEIKLIKDKSNYIEINEKYIEIYIKEKYIENKEYIKKQYEKWLNENAVRIVENLVVKYQSILQKYNIKIPTIQIRQMKSRWGSCIPARNKVVFNLSLIKTPMCCIEYVVLHELAHFKYQNHSKDFYNFIALFMPDWKNRKQLLDKKYTVVIY